MTSELPALGSPLVQDAPKVHSAGTSEVPEADDAVTHIYPASLTRHLRYTAPLPFVTCLVAAICGFYGLALVEMLLGVTSVCYWWWPYTSNRCRQVDMTMVVVALVYCFSVGVRLSSPWHDVWLIGLCAVVVIMTCNETHMYLRVPKVDEQQRLSIFRCNLYTHCAVAHIAPNIVCCSILILRAANDGLPGIGV